MGKSHLHHVGRVAGRLRCPIPEARSKTVDGDVAAPHPLQGFQQGHFREWLASPLPNEDEAILIASFPWQGGKEFNHAVRQRYPVLPAALHPRRRNCPRPRVEIDLRPLRADHLAGAGGRKNCKLQRSVPRRLRDRASASMKAGSSAVGQGGVVLDSLPYDELEAACPGAHAISPGSRPGDSHAPSPNRSPTRSALEGVQPSPALMPTSAQAPSGPDRHQPHQREGPQTPDRHRSEASLSIGLDASGSSKPAHEQRCTARRTRRKVTAEAILR